MTNNNCFMPFNILAKYYLHIYVNPRTVLPSKRTFILPVMSLPTKHIVVFIQNEYRFLHILYLHVYIDGNIVAVFRGMHVSQAKHIYA